MNGTDYKSLYKSLTEIHKADGAIAEAREQLWREAYKALLSASGSNTARSWREASRRLFKLAEELASDVVMLNGILAKRDEITDAALLDEPKPRETAAMRTADNQFADFFRDTLKPSKAAKITPEQPKGKTTGKK